MSSSDDDDEKLIFRPLYLLIAPGRVTIHTNDPRPIGNIDPPYVLIVIKPRPNGNRVRIFGVYVYGPGRSERIRFEIADLRLICLLAGSGQTVLQKLKNHFLGLSKEAIRNILFPRAPELNELLLTRLANRSTDDRGRNINSSSPSDSSLSPSDSSSSSSDSDTSGNGDNYRTNRSNASRSLATLRYPGQTDFEQFMNAFMAGIGAHLFVFPVLRMNQRKIGQPFFPINAKLPPMANRPEDHLTQSAGEFISYYAQMLIAIARGRLSLRNSNLSFLDQKRILAQINEQSVRGQTGNNRNVGQNRNVANNRASELDDRLRARLQTGDDRETRTLEDDDFPILQRVGATWLSLIYILWKYSRDLFCKGNLLHPEVAVQDSIVGYAQYQEMKIVQLTCRFDLFQQQAQGYINRSRDEFRSHIGQMSNLRQQSTSAIEAIGQQLMGQIRELSDGIFSSVDEKRGSVLRDISQQLDSALQALATLERNLRRDGNGVIAELNQKRNDIMSDFTQRIESAIQSVKVMERDSQLELDKRMNDIMTRLDQTSEKTSLSLTTLRDDIERLMRLRMTASLQDLEDSKKNLMVNIEQQRIDALDQFIQKHNEGVSRSREMAEELKRELLDISSQNQDHIKRTAGDSVRSISQLQEQIRKVFLDSQATVRELEAEALDKVDAGIKIGLTTLADHADVIINEMNNDVAEKAMSILDSSAQPVINKTLEKIVENIGPIAERIVDQRVGQHISEQRKELTMAIQMGNSARRIEANVRDLVGSVNEKVLVVNQRSVEVNNASIKIGEVVNTFSANQASTLDNLSEIRNSLREMGRKTEDMQKKIAELEGENSALRAGQRQMELKISIDDRDRVIKSLIRRFSEMEKKIAGGLICQNCTKVKRENGLLPDYVAPEPNYIPNSVLPDETIEKMITTIENNRPNASLEELDRKINGDSSGLLPNIMDLAVNGTSALSDNPFNSGPSSPPSPLDNGPLTPGAMAEKIVARPIKRFSSCYRPPPSALRSTLQTPSPYRRQIPANLKLTKNTVPDIPVNKSEFCPAKIGLASNLGRKAAGRLDIAKENVAGKLDIAGEKVSGKLDIANEKVGNLDQLINSASQSVTRPSPISQKISTNCVHSDYDGGGRVLNNHEYTQEDQGEQYEGEQYEGEQYEGEQYGGEQYEGEQYEGEQYEGEQHGGEQYEGEQYGGEDYSETEIDHGGDKYKREDHSETEIDHGGDKYKREDYSETEIDHGEGNYRPYNRDHYPAYSPAISNCSEDSYRE